MFLHRKHKCSQGHEFEWRWYAEHSRRLNVERVLVVGQGNVMYQVETKCPVCGEVSEVKGSIAPQPTYLSTAGYFVMQIEDSIWILYQENGSEFETPLARFPAWDPITASYWGEAWLKVRDSETTQHLQANQAIMAAGMSARRLTFLRGDYVMLTLEDAVQRLHHWAVRKASVPVFLTTGTLEEAKEIAEAFLSGQGL